jgi:hypothetical protein
MVGAAFLTAIFGLPSGALVVAVAFLASDLAFKVLATSLKLPPFLGAAVPVLVVSDLLACAFALDAISAAFDAAPANAPLDVVGFELGLPSTGLVVAASVALLAFLPTAAPTLLAAPITVLAVINFNGDGFLIVFFIGFVPEVFIIKYFKL